MRKNHFHNYRTKVAYNDHTEPSWISEPIFPYGQRDEALILAYLLREEWVSEEELDDGEGLTRDRIRNAIKKLIQIYGWSIKVTHADPYTDHFSLIRPRETRDFHEEREQFIEDVFAHLAEQPNLQRRA